MDSTPVLGEIDTSSPFSKRKDFIPEGVPLLDYADFKSEDHAKRTAFVQALGDAFTTIGFVRLVNSGVDLPLLKKTYAASASFFKDQTPEAKNKCIANNNGARGFTPFGIEKAKGAEIIDLKEFYHIGRELPEGHELSDHPQYGGNVWPAIEGWKETISAMYTNLDGVGLDILSALAVYLGLDAAFFKPYVQFGNSVFRLIWYPAMDGEMKKLRKKGAVRAQAHEDINLITLLCAATSSGLQVLPPGGTKWVDVINGPNELIVDGGDMLKRWFPFIPATTHRVVATTDEDAQMERFSIPFFVHPTPTTPLDHTKLPEGLRNLMKKKGIVPPEPISAGDFLKERLIEIGLQEAEGAALAVEEVPVDTSI